jgi:hypothetical protein
MGSLESARTNMLDLGRISEAPARRLIYSSFAEYSFRLVPNPMRPPKLRWQAKFSVTGIEENHPHRALTLVNPTDFVTGFLYESIGVCSVASLLSMVQPCSTNNSGFLTT